MGCGYDKMIIQKDFLGLWVNAGGYVSRPVSSTQFKVGQDVKTYHFGGSARAGVGKDITCNKGHYLEYWITTGLLPDEMERLYKTMPRNKVERYIKNNWNFYQNKKFDAQMLHEFCEIMRKI